MKRVLYLVCIVGVFTAAFYAVSWAGADGDAVTSPSGQLVDSPLAAASRDVLSVCIAGDILDGGATDLIKRGLEGIRREVADRTTNWTAWLDDARVVRGCPAPRYLGAGRVARDGAIRTVAEASPHRLLIYVITENQFQDAFGEGVLAEVPEEALCQGHVCAEVTTALYVKRLDPGTVREALIEGLGLLPLRVAPGQNPSEAGPRDAALNKVLEEGRRGRDATQPHH